MVSLKSFLVSFILIMLSLPCHLSAQTNDSAIDSTSQEGQKNASIRLTGFVLPSLLFAYGYSALESDELQEINHNFRAWTNKNFPTYTSIDNFTQYLPTATVYSLHAFGIKGKNSTKDVVCINLISMGLMAGIVESFKSNISFRRPDFWVNYSDRSFPSGHTATAFVNAEILWQEYHHEKAWLGYAGYGVAAFTGFCRIRNDRHWLSDVAAGAGIGLISTKLVYLAYPTLKKWVKKRPAVTILPQYNGTYKGAQLSYQF